MDNLMPEQSALFRRARRVLGDQSQVDKCIEECLELALALQHYKDGKMDEERVIQEIADAQITSTQMAQLFGESRVAAVRAQKLARLERHLDDVEDRCTA